MPCDINIVLEVFFWRFNLFLHFICFSGPFEVGEGYTEFKRRGRDPEEAALKKKRIKIESRIRPDNVQYYIPSTNFIGWKKDYVFTTRENYGTGYYWDGTDSARESFCVSNPGSNEPSASSCAQPSIPNNYWDKISHIADRGAVCDSKNNNRNKEAKRSITTEVEVAASYNPLEQVSNAISRAAKAVMDIPATTMPSGDKATQDELTDCSLAAAGWVRALDPLSGKTYFYHRTTKETSWEVPLSSSRNTERNFPAGWSAATDQKSGLEYYFHESGETTWVRPSV